MSLSYLSVKHGQDQPKQQDEAQQIKKKFDFRPVVPGILESAPAYAEIVKVTDFPKVSGCVAIKIRCQCYLQQGTKLTLPDDNCCDLVKNTRFNPYRAPTQQIANNGHDNIDVYQTQKPEITIRQPRSYKPLENPGYKLNLEQTEIPDANI